QNSADDVKSKDFRKELEERERLAQLEKDGKRSHISKHSSTKRAAEEAKREEEQRNYENKIRMENILSGNPLLSAGKSTNFKVKRRWDDDVVFKNCAKDDLKDKDKSFINDTLRSDFHKKFMEKYIK
ncbi:hypothetical protein BLA29_002328, partial [Euroglyphus maynei]